MVIAHASCAPLLMTHLKLVRDDPLLAYLS